MPVLGGEEGRNFSQAPSCAAPSSSRRRGTSSSRSAVVRPSLWPSSTSALASRGCAGSSRRCRCRPQRGRSAWLLAGQLDSPAPERRMTRRHTHSFHHLSAGVRPTGGCSEALEPSLEASAELSASQNCSAPCLPDLIRGEESPLGCLVDADPELGPRIIDDYHRDLPGG